MKSIMAFFANHWLFLLGFLPLAVLNLLMGKHLLSMIFTSYHKTLQDIFPDYDDAKLKRAASIGGFRKWGRIIFNREITSLSRGDRELSSRYLYFYLSFFLVLGYLVFFLIRVFTWQESMLPY
ncbi:MAG: hypothetical protein HPY53_16550 [Brevinematales bacterium]|nr:hypothetical protein [Brevinematales bacterium]